MNRDEQDNTKTVITERFINALDYLIDSGRVKSVAEFERQTGFRAQRITGMKAFLSEEDKTTKGQYAGTQHIKMLRDLFNVSLEYIFDGTKPIVKENDPVDMARPDLAASESGFMKKEMRLINEKIELLEKRLEFYKEMVSQKLS